MSRRTTACTIPATGVFPAIVDVRIVRAIAPVTGIPPKRGTTIFAAPWAINSVLELCLSPVTPSATVAESKDSMAPRMAIVKAEGRRRFIISYKLNRRGLGHGCLDGKAVADGFDAGEVEIRPPI